jgi:hypothetical protein
MVGFVCFYIDYSLLLFIVLWMHVDQSNCTSSVVRACCRPKEGVGPAVIILYAVCPTPLYAYSYKRFIRGFGSIQRFGPIRRLDTPTWQSDARVTGTGRLPVI